MTSEVAAGGLPPRRVVASAALAALAVPARFAILSHLLAAGPRTASQCAKVVGESPSNCSWHLRELAKVGLVEPSDLAHSDGRAKLWQATAAGFDLSGGDEPAERVALTALAVVAAEHVDRAYGRYLARQDELPEDWTEVSGANEYALDLTPAELEKLLEAVDALVRPYVRPIRKDAPANSEVVHVTLRAFLETDLFLDR
ncbi:winged helix-turn-helix domain-containing protein [Mumia sp. zg.B53]|uniref:winged helix-turn-helix domain-containing protein n=1 Tax=Mumia sp. zg.B53 TaxID=2855449 RepID=UPI001C6E758A|nr:winged helix-turn-helix domain-containing protein [Mumia sp. zg.B53]MBW9214919.1 winged helix-turn-helix domain-containing protein [Mumia sp. zg.B53]